MRKDIIERENGVELSHSQVHRLIEQTMQNRRCSEDYQRAAMILFAYGYTYSRQTKQWTKTR